MYYFDTHAHYDDDKFSDDRDEVIKSLFKSGVTKIVNMGCDVESSKFAIKLANIYEYIFAGVGLHPENIPQTKEELLESIEEIKQLIISNKKVVAVGEVGLDYYWRDDNKELQKEALIMQIAIANELKLPISIHTRDSIDDMIHIIRNYKMENSGVLHCVPFNKELVRHGLENGLYMGFGGTCTFKNSKNAKEIIQMVPKDKILIETDSPYLSPEPRRGIRNDSRNLKFIVQKIAEFTNSTPEEITNVTYNNALNLFKLNEKVEK